MPRKVEKIIRLENMRCTILAIIRDKRLMVSLTNSLFPVPTIKDVHMYLIVLMCQMTIKRLIQVFMIDKKWTSICNAGSA